MTATAWASHTHLTDAGSLAKVLSVTESFGLEINESNNNFICLNIKSYLKVNQDIVKPEKKRGGMVVMGTGY